MGAPRPCLIRNLAQAPILAKRKTRAMKQRAEERAKVASKSAALAAKREKRRRFMRKPDVTHRAALERVLKKVATKGGELPVENTVGVALIARPWHNKRLIVTRVCSQLWGC